MKLSVIIVNYNVKYFLEQCLDSALSAAKNMEAEILVADNCSSDGSLEYLIPKFPQVKFVRNEENKGFSRANNKLIRESEGEYVLLLNPDTVIGESCLTNVCGFMDTHPNCGALGVKMLNGFGEFLPESKRGFPSPWNSFTKMSGLARLFPMSKTFGGYHLRYFDENEIHEVDVLAGAFMLLRRGALRKSGLLDETFFMYGEDIDLSYRIKQSGYVNYYFPEPIIHYKGESTKKDIKYVKHFYEAMLIFFNKHYPNSNGLFKVLIRMAIVCSGSLAALQKILPIQTLNRKQKFKKSQTFNKNEISYDQLIQAINKFSGEKTLFKIYHPERGITVAANEILTIKQYNNGNITN
jgi:GT2 family glycosyltransferase